MSFAFLYPTRMKEYNIQPETYDKVSKMYYSKDKEGLEKAYTFTEKIAVENKSFEENKIIYKDRIEKIRSELNLLRK